MVLHYPEYAVMRDRSTGAESRYKVDLAITLKGFIEPATDDSAIHCDGNPFSQLVVLY